MIPTGAPPTLQLALEPDLPAQGPALVHFVAEADDPAQPAGDPRDAARLPDWVLRSLAALRTEGEFHGRSGELLLLHAGDHPGFRRVLLAGIGPLPSVTADGLRRASAAAIRRLLDAGLDNGVMHVPARAGIALAPALRVQALAEGALLGSYAFRAYRSDSAPTSKAADTAAQHVTLWGPDLGDEPALAAGLARGKVVGEAVWLARDLCNHPGNVLTPECFVETATAIAGAQGLKATLIDAAGLARAGMGGLLGVGAGSRHPPALLVLDYQPAGVAPEHPIVLVGKTVTFDSGGISLKVALDMEQMKADMTGGAAVLAALRGAARAGLQRRIVALFAIVENMPGGNALRPGDILTMASGTTVEVLNTDAEGRLILADALHYARRFEPACVIDVATLTGASAIVFGDAFNALFSTAPAYAQRMRQAGEFSGERLWPMPLATDYAELLRSDVADLRNIAGQRGAMLIAAAFLQHFAADMPWLHLDVYNTCWSTGNQPWLSKGATGGGTRVLTQFLLDLDEPVDPDTAI